MIRAIRRCNFRASYSSDTRQAVKNTDTHSVGRGLGNKPLRKFWKTVDIMKDEENGKYKVTLDGRNIKTPFGKPLIVGSPTLAELVASEWDTPSEFLKPTSLQMTSLVARSIDGLSDETEREKVISFVMRYIDTDSIWYLAVVIVYYHDTPDRLVKMQNEIWSPIIASIEKQFQVKINTTHGIAPIKQSEETKRIFKEHVRTFNSLKLAGFEKAVMHSKSFLIALALVEREIGVEEAAKAARLESIAQSQIWGEVEDTHDVEHADMHKQLASTALLLLEREK